MKVGNDQIFDMTNVDEMNRRIQWSENEFSHSLSLQPTPVGAGMSAFAPRHWSGVAELGSLVIEARYFYGHPR